MRDLDVETLRGGKETRALDADLEMRTLQHELLDWVGQADSSLTREV